MKRIAIFVIAFIAVAIPAANYLASRDPEPDMAGLSLLFLGFFGLLAGLGVFAWSTAHAQAAPRSILTFFTCVACATCFYAALGLIPAGLGFAYAMALSFALVLFVAWASTLLLRAGA